MYFNVQKKHQVFLTPLTEGLGCTVRVIRMQWNISSGGTQNLLWSQGEQGGVRKMHFPVEQELLRGREWGKLDCLLWASCPEEELPQQKGPQRRGPSRVAVPTGEGRGAHTWRCALFSSGAGISGVTEGCLPIIWCENYSQMLEGNLLNIPKCTLPKQKKKTK